MDLMMPGMGGVTATRKIHKKYPQVKVIAPTSFAEQNMVPGALQAGAVNRGDAARTSRQYMNSASTITIVQIYTGSLLRRENNGVWSENNVLSDFFRVTSQGTSGHQNNQYTVNPSGNPLGFPTNAPPIGIQIVGWESATPAGSTDGWLNGSLGRLDIPTRTFSEWQMPSLAKVIAVVSDDPAAEDRLIDGRVDNEHPTKALIYAGPFTVEGRLMAAEEACPNFEEHSFIPIEDALLAYQLDKINPSVGDGAWSTYF